MSLIHRDLSIQVDGYATSLNLETPQHHLTALFSIPNFHTSSRTLSFCTSYYVHSYKSTIYEVPTLSPPLKVT